MIETLARLHAHLWCRAVYLGWNEKLLAAFVRGEPRLLVYRDRPGEEGSLEPGGMYQTLLLFHLHACNTFSYPAQPSECGRQRTLNSVHGHTAARLQSNGNLAV